MRTIVAAILCLLLVASGCGESNEAASEPEIRPTPTARPTSTPSPYPTPTPSPTPSLETAPATSPTTAPSQASPTPAPATPVPATPAPEPFQVETVSWQQCGSISCATVQVPLDHANPQGPTIKIGLTLHRATGQRLGVLLANPGGPGAAGIGFASAIANNDSALRSRFDIIGWDPRGVGQSTPLQCGQGLLSFYELDSDPDTPEEQEQLDSAAQAVANDCAANDGDLLPHLGTNAVIEDLELIRQALGEEKLNFLGASYGTLIGALYAEAYGENVRAMVLDGVVNPALPLDEWLIGQAVEAEAALSRIFGRCGNSCDPDQVATAFDDLLARAERGEIDNGTGGTLTATQVLHAAIIVLYRPQAEGNLRQAILSADGAALASLSQNYTAFGGWNVYTAVSCVDSPHPVGAEAFADFAQRAEDAAPHFGADVANELLPCAFWPDVPVREGGPVTAPNAPPVLVVGNTGDTATPYVNAVELAASMQSGVLLTHEGSGHTSYLDNACVDTIIRAYLIDLVVPQVGSVCV